ncbi:peptidylprolyl isomerase [Pseudaeromonas paramecii]|uniref:Peptidyl-prolyl cis-trans isomerase n=1 Tax=Pseudaeromonas paramecii TaxID=2138166 RepID=A0ABP8QEV0_9GAMM
MKNSLILALLLCLPTLTWAGTKVAFDTTEGRILVELEDELAPATVSNFLQYVSDGSYNGSLFHRVIKGFVVQGGGYREDGSTLPNLAPITNESKNGLSNLRGTLAMARTAAPHSATRQFFFNLVDNTRLDGGAQWGYAVFGKVIEGLPVLDAIAAHPTGFDSKLGANDVPQDPVVLKSVTVLP